MTSTLLKKHSFDTVFDSQKVFRLLLEAMANPTRIVHINEYANKLHGEFPAFLALAMTLLDNEVCFCAYGNQLLSDEIASLTLAKREGIDSADFIFVRDPGDIKTVIENGKSGTLSDPHKSATVFIVNDDEPNLWATFFGPGIDGRKTIRTSGTVRDAVVIRDAQGYEYPRGVDLVFVSGKGELTAVPRLTRMEVE